MEANVTQMHLCVDIHMFAYAAKTRINADTVVIKKIDKKLSDASSSWVIKFANHKGSKSYFLENLTPTEVFEKIESNLFNDRLA